ncbi:hypothetical protein ACNSOO_08705 [Aliarcobacter lanthieri]|uniref:hypothetical protein n=1 Tax=Aliarcobacter lanthieri TaxID=1355374 RepID=UPI003AAA3650
MYYPNKYEEHNIAQRKLIEIFNQTANKLGSEVEMYFQEHENFRDDGGIIYKSTGEKILYDFEKRHTYYNTYKNFRFTELGQFERKIQKNEIKLSVQISTDESGLILAWHEDYVRKNVNYIKSKTEDGKGEINGKRFTSDFIEISYKNIEIFYHILVKAFKEKKFNKESFKNFVLNNKIICEYTGCNKGLTDKVYNYSIAKYQGRAYCYDCQKKV